MDEPEKGAAPGIITESLGFPFRVVIAVGTFEKLGTHKTFESGDSGLVPATATHYIQIKQGLAWAVLNTVVAHEAYHLFYSVRHLITASEEIQAEVFGEIVGRIHEAVREVESDAGGTTPPGLEAPAL